MKNLIKLLLRKLGWRLEKLRKRKDYNNEIPPEKLLHALANCSGVFHLGAHRGEEAPIYEWFGKKVIWIEANPIIFQDLTDNLIKYKFQKAYQALISNSDNQKIDFYLSSNDYASSSIFKFGNLSSGKNSLWPDKNLKHIDKKELLSITIDSLIKINSIDIKNYDHWVVDLQGAELLALEGSIQNLKFCKTLYIEVSEGEVYSNGAKWNDILNFLSKNKYRQMWDLKSNHTNVLFIKSN
jgi:FkbM family methyltransferase